MARTPFVARKAIRGGSPAGVAATPNVWVVSSPVAAMVRSSIRPVFVSIVVTCGCERPRSDTVATIRVSSIQAGPWRPLTIQPLRSVSVQLPITRSSSLDACRGSTTELSGGSSLKSPITR